MRLNCVCVINIKDLFSALSQNMAQPSTTLLPVTIIRQTDRERERLLFLGNAGMGGCWMVLRVQMPEMLLMPGSACARPHTHKYKSHLYSQKHSEKQYGLIVVLFNNSLLCMCVAADIISAVEFNHSGELLATGDRGGRIVIFQQEQEVRWITVHYAEQLKGGA